ncbi:MAG: DUF1002 domain-containing protein [Syntrophomonadaceae bacterium]|nr:DUF1002 domain-containing protein [Syntrophomonadaceae bacterium]
MQKKLLAMGIVLIILLAGIITFKTGAISTALPLEKPKAIITLGEDLTDEQKEKVMKVFEKWSKGKDVHFITVTNEEERKYLQGKVDDKLIGSRAISSTYLELLSGTSGIEVRTENINAITPFMYANALTTAGVEDARVIVAAPFEVSGTAALTGIIKAFETVSNEKLDNTAKETAYEELTETYKLSNKYGQKNTQHMFYEIKRQVIEKEAVTDEEIKPIIIEISNHYSIDLTEEEVDRIIALMKKYQHIKLDTGKIDEQLQNVTRNLAEVQGAVNNAANIINQIINFFKNMIVSLQNMFS